jgi:hypothetical protein
MTKDLDRIMSCIKCSGYNITIDEEGWHCNICKDEKNIGENND